MAITRGAGPPPVACSRPQSSKWSTSPTSSHRSRLLLAATDLDCRSPTLPYARPAPYPPTLGPFGNCRNARFSRRPELHLPSARRERSERLSSGFFTLSLPYFGSNSTPLPLSSPLLLPLLLPLPSPPFPPPRCPRAEGERAEGRGRGGDVSVRHGTRPLTGTGRSARFSTRDGHSKRTQPDCNR